MVRAGGPRATVLLALAACACRAASETAVNPFLRPSDQDLEEATGLNAEDAVEKLCAVQDRKCFIPLQDVGGGGLGTVLTLVADALKVALQVDCVFLHRPSRTRIISHDVDRDILHHFFGLGHGCLALSEGSGKRLWNDGMHKTKDHRRSVFVELLKADGIALPDGEEHLTVEHRKRMRLAGGEFTKSGTIDGPCGGDLSEETLCWLGRPKYFLDETHVEHNLAMQVLRTWYAAVADMPEKQLAWFDDKAFGNKQGGPVPFEIVVHLRRGDVTHGMQRRWTSTEEMTLMFETLSDTLPDGEEHLTVEHRKRMRLAGGEFTKSGTIDGPCGGDLSEETLCWLGRPKYFLDETHVEHNLAMQVLRTWYAAVADMPEKQLAWFDDKAFGNKQGGPVPFEIVVHLRRGDVTHGMQRRWTSTEEMTLMFETLSDTLAAAQRDLRRDSGDRDYKVRGIKWRVHLLSQAQEKDLPLQEWRGLLKKAGAELVLHLEPRRKKKETDLNVLPAFAHMAGADLLMHGVSRYPQFAGRYYSRNLVVEYKEPRDAEGEEEKNIRHRTGDKLVEAIVDYVRRRWK